MNKKRKEKKYIKFVKRILKVLKHLRVRKYSHKFSKKTYGNWVHIVLLALRQEFDKSLLARELIMLNYKINIAFVDANNILIDLKKMGIVIQEDSILFEYQILLNQLKGLYMDVLQTYRNDLPQGFPVTDYKASPF